MKRNSLAIGSGATLLSLLLTGGCPNLSSPATIDESGADANDAPAAEQRTIKADAGDTQAGTAGQLIVLNGSQSAPGQGARLSYYWKQVDGPVKVELIDGFSSNPRFFAPANITAPASLRFQLMVVDGFATATDEVDVIINGTGSP